MSNTTKRQITIERHSITTIRISGKSRFLFCQICQNQTLAFTSEQTANFLQIKVEEVLQQIESGAFHLIDRTGVMLICGNSLKEK